MTPVLVLLGLLVGLLAGTAALVATRVRRLHRLHQRLDAARAALDDALARRAAAALGAATAVGADPPVPGPVDRSAVAPLTVSAAGVDPAAVTAPVAPADRSAAAPPCGP
ncbi:MAG: hypothetical protein NTW05_01490, partial [Pseudonocardiales bacterium]|nr:hypothetical protein [Pseudonocardiales bacterium]